MDWQKQRKHLLVESRERFIAADLLFILFEFSCFACLVESKPVKQEVSRTAILPPMVSLLWSWTK